MSSTCAELRNESTADARSPNMRCEPAELEELLAESRRKSYSNSSVSAHAGRAQEGLARHHVPRSLKGLHGLYDEGKAEGTRRVQTSATCRTRHVSAVLNHPHRHVPSTGCDPSLSTVSASTLHSAHPHNSPNNRDKAMHALVARGGTVVDFLPVK